ncbi:MAG: hypothetical protein OHK0021_00700 [Bryobacter sp.]
MCRPIAIRRANLPEPVFLKRFAAPLWVFSFGIFVSFGGTFGDSMMDLEKAARVRCGPAFTI